MNFIGFVKTVAWLLMLYAAAFCLSANTVSVDPNSAFFIGLEYSRTKREGFYDFSELRKSQPVPRNNLGMLGGSVGKRWMMNKRVRLQAGFGYAAGSAAADDTLPLITPVSVRHSFYHAGVDPVMQFPLAFTGRMRPFLFLGGGADILYTVLRTFSVEDGKEVEYTNFPWLYVRSVRLSMHAAAGFGLDYALARSATVSLWYTFQYWQPVKYEVKEDFLYTTQWYHENFSSNRFQLTILFDVK